MAYPTDDSQTPTPDTTQPAPPQAAQAMGKDVAGQWRDWIQNPENRASLMQFGIALMQPIGVGQTPIGHFGQALGQGGEAADRVQREEMAKQKLASESDLREQRANLAEQRAGVVGQNLTLQQEMLELKRQLGISAKANELQKRFEDAKILNPKLNVQDFIAQNQQFIKSLQAQEPGGGTRAAPREGDIRSYQGQQYRFKGGANVQANWEPL
jgi:hypothetical protein